MPPSAWSQSSSLKLPSNASRSIWWALSRVSLSRSEVWIRRAVWTPVRDTLAGLPRLSWPRPVEAHGLARPDLRDPVDVIVIDDTYHRIPAGYRVVRPEDHGHAVGRYLDGAPHGAFARQLTAWITVLERAPHQAHPHPIASIRCHP